MRLSEKGRVVMETKYGFGEHTKKETHSPSEEYLSYLKKMPLGKLTREKAKDAIETAKGGFIPRQGLGSPTFIKARSNELQNRIKKDFKRTGKSESWNRYTEDSNRYREEAGLPSRKYPEKVPAAILKATGGSVKKKKKAKGGYVKKYAKGSGVRKAR